MEQEETPPPSQPQTLFDEPKSTPATLFEEAKTTPPALFDEPKGRGAHNLFNDYGDSKGFFDEPKTRIVE
jgi:hypothetical protein